MGFALGAREGVEAGWSVVLVLEVGRGAPTTALGRMRVEDAMLRGECRERMYVLGWMRVFEPMVMGWVPRT